MRCRKVRSYLSAYCNDELTGRRQASIREHLGRCADCRREEAFFRELNGSVSTLPKLRVTDDFNTRLLNRIAQERFKETRTKAFFPKRAPVLGWGRLVPAVATVCLVLAFVFSGGLGILDKHDQPTMLANQDQGNQDMDTLYRIIQPNEDHVFTAHSTNWAFEKQVAKANRIRNLMNQLASQSSFGNTAQLAGSSYYNGYRPMMIILPLDRRTPSSTYTSQGVLTAEEAQ
ncbi:MAG: zf-HC2 domain-containing protein [Candidatus Zixiibacteriota bacterium]